MLIYRNNICGYIEYVGKESQGNVLYRLMAKVDDLCHGDHYQPVSEIPYSEQTVRTMVGPCLGYFIEPYEETPEVRHVPFNE